MMKRIHLPAWRLTFIGCVLIWMLLPKPAFAKDSGNKGDASPPWLVGSLTNVSVLIRVASPDDKTQTAGTGLVAKFRGAFLLLANRHVIGRYSVEGAFVGDEYIRRFVPPSPLRLVPGHRCGVLIFLKNKSGEPLIHPEDLHFPDGMPRWHEHPNGNLVDVVALKLTLPPEADLSYLDFDAMDLNQIWEPGESIGILGFPKSPEWLRSQFWALGYTVGTTNHSNPITRSVSMVGTVTNGMSGSPIFKISDLGLGVTNMLSSSIHPELKAFVGILHSGISSTNLPIAQGASSGNIKVMMDAIPADWVPRQDRPKE